MTMLVTVKLNDQQAHMLDEVRVAKCLNTRTSALLLCIAEMHKNLFAQEKRYNEQTTAEAKQ